MKIKLMSVLIPMMGLFFASPALAETWSITEGVSGEWSGTWDLPVAGQFFDCSQTSTSGDTLTAKCAFSRDENNITVRKVDVSDGNTCSYSGRQNGTNIVGTYYCNSGGPYNWSATVSN